MFDYKLESVEKKLRKLYEKGRLSHREIYVFGVSESTRQIIQILRTFHLEPSMFWTMIKENKILSAAEFW